MIVRKQLSVLQTRLAEPRRFIQVLAGPRQVGKTTLIKQLVKEAQVPITFVSADSVEPSQTTWISDQWRMVRIIMQTQHQSEHVLIIDEVHKIDRWSEVVKKEWDADTFNDVNIKVVLLGSSRLLLKDGLTESLMGRFELIRMPHWDFQEMREAFDFSVEQYIYFGGFPGAASLINNETRWRNYIQDAIATPAIEKDVLMTKRIIKPALMRQTFQIGCAYSGQLLAFNKMIGQLQDAGNTNTLANYLMVLDEANLLGGIQKYAVDTARKYNSINKLQVYNNAFLSLYEGHGFTTEYLDHVRWGRWVESAVGAYLANYSDQYNYRLYYWRDSESNEVDFIIARQQQCIAIEVKSGRRKSNQGIYLFEQRYHPQKTLVVGEEGLPLELFFTLDLQHLFDV